MSASNRPLAHLKKRVKDPSKGSRRAAVEGWIQTSSAGTSDDGECGSLSGEDDSFQRDGDMPNGAQAHAELLALESIQSQLRTASLKRRRELLCNRFPANLQAQAEWDSDFLASIISTLTPTYTRYQDRRSREYVIKAWRFAAIAARKQGPRMIEQFYIKVASWADTETARLLRVTSSSRSQYCIACWIITWLSGIQELSELSENVLSLARSLSRVSMLLLMGGEHVQRQPQRGTSSEYAPVVSALIRKLSAFANQREDICEQMVSALLFKSKGGSVGSSTPLTSTEQAHFSEPLLFMPVLSTLVDTRPILKTRFSKELLQVWTGNVLVSRPPAIATVRKMGARMLSMIEKDQWDHEILPAIDKAFLRSFPEAVLATDELIRVLSFELVDVVDSSQWKLMLNNAKSTNPAYRDASLSLFSAVTANVRTAKTQLMLFDQISGQLKMKTAGADHRVTLFLMLACLGSSPCQTNDPARQSKEIIDMLLTEVNETVLSASSRALTNYFRRSTLDKQLADALDTGLKSGKTALVTALCIAIGDAVRCWDQNLTKLQSSLRKLIIEALDPKASINTIPTNAIIAMVMLLEYLQDETVFDIPGLLNTSPKPSFLFSERTWSKVTQREDRTWMLRAETAVLSHGDLGENVLQNAAHGFVRLATQGSSLEENSLLRDCLNMIGMTSSEIAFGCICKSIEAEIFSNKKIVSAENGSVTRRRTQGFAAIILNLLRASAKYNETPAAGNILMLCSVLCHHPDFEELLLREPFWVQAIKASGQEPGTFVSQNQSRLIEKVMDFGKSKDPSHVQASMSLASTLAILSPITVLPDLLHKVYTDLDDARFRKLNHLDLEIYHASEGKLVVNPIKNKEPQASRHLSKEQLWEEELRASLAKKKQTLPSYSKAEQDAIDTQLEKENSIRSAISELVNEAKRSLDILHSLATRAGDALLDHLSEVLAILVKLIRASQGLLNDFPVDLYLQLARFCGSRLATIAPLIGSVSLRCNGARINQHYSEPLASQVSRILHRVHFASESLPLEAPSFAYVAPLLDIVISSGGFGDEQDTCLEQLTLTMNILARHASLAQDETFPRAQVVGALISAVERYPKLNKAAVTALIDVCKQIARSGFPASLEISLLLTGLLASEGYARRACLMGLLELDLTDVIFPKELWIACCDVDEGNASLALQIWEENALDLHQDFPAVITAMLDFPARDIQLAAAKSLTAGARNDSSTISTILEMVQDLYRERAKPLLPEYDRYGLVIQSTIDRPDPWQTRLACADALREMASLIPNSCVIQVFHFLIEGLAMSDRNEEVCQAMLAAGLAVLDHQGMTATSELIAYFEKALANADKSRPTNDRITENVIVLYGNVSRNLNAEDLRIPQIVERLVETLKTPSEMVQAAVAECLPPLIKLMKTNDDRLVDDLLDKLLHAPRYAERRGSAYGLAGVVKGRGLGVLKDCQIISRLREAADDKKNPLGRQGAVFAFETMFSVLGRLFEPYVVQVLPVLLSCFGDQTPDVREATSEAAKVIMSKISGHGVKLILPSLLNGLEEKQWRTKKGSIELLGAMAYCAPKQLSVSLPTIIPRLTEVLTDSHPQVRAAGNKSLKQFGEVISNPEIQGLVSTLLKAMIDPAAKTQAALQALIDTAFVHYIDSPSLALIIPILERGLRERSADVKRKAAQIVGNMASLTDPKDLVVYLARLIPLVREVLVDPVPSARATAAKALGTLVEKLGERNFPHIVDDLMLILQSDASGVDRQGAAQGLSEVLAGLGIERLEDLLPDVIKYTSSARASVREGFISLLVFLPATFGTRFANYLNRTIEPVLRGLADESDYVREASMRAGRIIVANYSTKAVDMLLPELEQGLFNESHRIRQSSIQLVGDLLFRVSGITAKNDSEIDEEEDELPGTVTEGARSALMTALGSARRDRILASIYIIRQDSSGPVRLASVHIWKAFVSNTPKVVKEILPSLLSIIIQLLSSAGEEQHQVSTRTLGEIVKKLGESILHAIVPLLQKNLSARDTRRRQGVCLALNEMILTLSKSQLVDYEETLLQAVRDALLDDDVAVRHAAARTFSTMSRVLGPSAAQNIVPSLLRQLGEEAPEVSIEALQELMSVQPNTIFPMLAPTLTKLPLTPISAKALGVLAPLAGNALSRSLTSVIKALAMGMHQPETSHEVQSSVRDASELILASLTTDDGLNALMLMLLSWCSDMEPLTRQDGCHLLEIFINSNKKADISDYRVDWLRQLISMLEDRDDRVVLASSQTLYVMTSSMSKDEMPEYTTPAARAVENLGGPGQSVAGLDSGKGIPSLLPIFLQGLLSGNADQREQGAYGLGYLADRASPETLKPYVTQMTGPLIRIIGDRYPSHVKIAILTSLSVLLRRVPQQLRPFFPQLQRTFVKSLYDSNSLATRVKGLEALGVLMTLQTRVDPVVTELITNAQSPQVEPEIRETLINGLAEAVRGDGGKYVGAPAWQSVFTLLNSAYEQKNTEEYDKAIAHLTAASTIHGPAQIIKTLLKTHIFDADEPTPPVALTLASLLEISPEAVAAHDLAKEVARTIKACLDSGNGPAVMRPARDARASFKSQAGLFSQEIIDRFFAS